MNCMEAAGKFLHTARMTFPGIFTILSLIVFSGCSGEHADTEQMQVEFGAIFNMTGSQTSLGESASRGAELAIDKVNGSGGLLGGVVGYRVEDGESDADVIARKTAELIKQYPAMTALFGLSDSDLALAAAKVSASGHKVFLTSGATSPQLPSQIPNYLFLACFGDNVQAAAGAEWARNDRDFRTAVVLYDSTEIYTTLLHQYFEVRFSELGGTVVESRPYDPATLNATVIGTLPDADLIFLSAEVPEDAYAMVSLLRDAGIRTPVLGGDGYDSEDIWKGHTEISDVFFTTHVYLGADNPDVSVQAFRKDYMEKWPEDHPDAFAALAYDSALLLAEAVRKGKSSEPEAVLKSLQEITDYHGVTGTISYGKDRRIPLKSVTIMEITEGSYRFVRQLTPESVPAP